MYDKALEAWRYASFKRNKIKLDAAYDRIVTDSIDPSVSDASAVANRTLLVRMLFSPMKLNLEAVESCSNTVDAIAQSLLGEDLTPEQMSKFQAGLKKSLPIVIENLIKDVREDDTGSEEAQSSAEPAVEESTENATS